MAHMEFFLVAEDLSVDQQTNRLSLFNIIEQLTGCNFPFPLPFAAAVSLWVAEDGDESQDFQCILHIILPDGETYDFPTNFTFKTRRHRVIQRIQGIPITKSGLLRFEVHLNGKHQASHEIDILKIDPHEMLPTAETI
ncbi:MAG TPA: hypothetical protein DCY27_14190 [Desulfobacterales bacterium]|nr:hypothetical protein [Desulfobacterales bacterium]